ncbi:MAG: hypothetical protein ACRC67_28545 [Inquilinus sp.]|uniref:hypothetical protein n=1 Tax=Inquilinus sp. TaxID=1932117 RepID=UPI003F37D99C
MSKGESPREEALREIGRSVRALAANLLRVIRGAGRADEIEQQTIDLLHAITAHRAATGYPPSAHDLTRILDIDYTPEFMARLSEGNQALAHAEQRIVRGCLQVVASRLLDPSSVVCF